MWYTEYLPVMVMVMGRLWQIWFWDTMSSKKPNWHMLILVSWNLPRVLEGVHIGGIAHKKPSRNIKKPSFGPKNPDSWAESNRNLAMNTCAGVYPLNYGPTYGCLSYSTSCPAGHFPALEGTVGIAIHSPHASWSPPERTRGYPVPVAYSRLQFVQ